MSLPSITKIDFNKVPENVPTLCIPRVSTNINELQIRKIFDNLELGIIDRIDLVIKYSHNGEKYNRIFIHFHKWFQDGNAKRARERLLLGNEIKVMYDEPWFWKISAYRVPNQKPNDNEYKPYIPLLVPPDPNLRQRNLEDKNYNNMNDINDINENSKKLATIYEKNSINQVNNLLFQRKKNNM